MVTTVQEYIAQQFHETYERLARAFEYETRKETAVTWAAVPEKNKALMVAVVGELLERGVIREAE